MGTSGGMPMSQANLESHTPSLHASLDATYSTFVVDRAIHSWRRDLQDMALPINRKMYPKVDFHLS